MAARLHYSLQTTTYIGLFANARNVRLYYPYWQYWCYQRHQRRSGVIGVLGVISVIGVIGVIIALQQRYWRWQVSLKNGSTDTGLQIGKDDERFRNGQVSLPSAISMNLIGERFFWYRCRIVQYRMQCDRGFNLILLSRE